MFVGTGSDVGKSVVAAAFCRIFKEDGYTPAPFKAQNMALNSYVTLDGLEIGRAQAMQAEAAGIACRADMNPLLLKPQSDHSSQVILNGRPYGNREAYQYFRREGRDFFRAEVCRAFDRLQTQYNPIVLEGAGSISELNLRRNDIVNMSMAQYAKADVILVADIDRGGVFASVYGSIMLLPPEERKLIKGIIINKFRGDIRLFDEGKRIMEELCGVPVLGVLPHFNDIYIEEEDSVSLAGKSMQAQRGRINVAVVLLRHISNFTDFDILERDERIHLFYTDNPEELSHADIIILPGTKSTLDDMYELRRKGLAAAILRARRESKTILGICGGYQLMGREILDRNHVEGAIERLPGLGLLPVLTEMEGGKQTRQVRFRMEEKTGCLVSDDWMQGYEIHCGRTSPTDGAPDGSFICFEDGARDGYRVDARCMGTYVHGILDNTMFVDYLLEPYRDKLSQAGNTFDYLAFKDQQYSKLAAHVRKHVDMETIYRMLQNTDVE